MHRRPPPFSILLLSFLFTVVQAARRSQARVDFFCRHHRASTLAAQYRFLPALLHVRASAAFQRRDFRWVSDAHAEETVRVAAAARHHLLASHLLPFC
eukprot:5974939-Pleurochrysis_carterae.AAC.1